MPRDDRYTRDEIARVVARASELQRRADSGEQPGLSREELVEALTETGIDRAVAERSIAGLELEKQQSKRGLLRGAPYTLQFEEFISGAVDPEAFDRMVAVLRHASGERGTADHQGARSTWRGGRMALSVLRQEGRSKLALSETVQPSLLATLAGFAASFAAVGYLGAALLGQTMGYDPARGVDEPMVGAIVSGAAGAVVGQYYRTRRAVEQERRLHERFLELQVLAHQALAPPESAAAATVQGDALSGDIDALAASVDVTEGVRLEEPAEV